MDFIAHIRDSDKEVQPVHVHLLEVKELAESYGKKIGIKHLAGLAGLLHDLGKYTNEFRDYITEAVFNSNSFSKRGSVDHSTAGGKLLYQLFHQETGNIDIYKAMAAEIVGNAIISHHSYLHDYLNEELESPYLKRVRDKQLDEYELAKHAFFENVMGESDFYNYVDKAAIELKDFLRKEKHEPPEKQLMFLTKFVFSALIDADRTNTRLFEENKFISEENVKQDLFEIYYERLMDSLNSLQANPDSDSTINKLRVQMSAQCDQFAEKPSGIYTLSIPTGGGKTLSSLRYALRHANLYNKKRIIYILPYTTIIEQNAEEVRKILKDDRNILEHHSNVVNDVNDNDEEQDGLVNDRQKLKIAKDNWDSPIIFTTMVQFLNVFYAKGSRYIRRLHNLSESVLIFDEVQKVPISCLSLFNQALNFLNTSCHSSILLCTATQPALDFVENKLALNADAEIIDNLNEASAAFKRVEIVDLTLDEPFSTPSLSDFIMTKTNEALSILVILNTKSAVKTLYNHLIELNLEIPVYHLSTALCPAHRNRILSEVKQHLKDGDKVICLSTQLIEAGVNVSFECVIRSLAGLDSIAQAAGRCNRHGEKEIQKVYVIDHSEENVKQLKEIKVGKDITKKILKDLHIDPMQYGGHLLSKEAMDKYFKEYYTAFKSNLNYWIPSIKKEMTELLSASKQTSSYFMAYKQNNKSGLPLALINSYKTAAKHFHVINNQTSSVIVPYGEGKEIIAELNGNGSIAKTTEILQRSQQYLINIFPHERKLLEQKQGLVSYFDGSILVLNETAYHSDFGLNLENDSPFEFNWM